MQPLLPTLDEGYLLTASPPDLERGVAPLGPPVPMQPLLLGRGIAPLGHLPWPRACGSSSWPPPLTSDLGSSSWPFLCHCSLALSVAAPDLRRIRDLNLYKKLQISLGCKWIVSIPDLGGSPVQLHSQSHPTSLKSCTGRDYLANYFIIVSFSLSSYQLWFFFYILSSSLIKRLPFILYWFILKSVHFL